MLTENARDGYQTQVCYLLLTNDLNHVEKVVPVREESNSMAKEHSISWQAAHIPDYEHISYTK